MPVTSDVTYFISNGLDFKQITLLNIIFTAAGMLLEVPTGWLADRYGRKNAIITSSILRAITYGGIVSTGSYPILCTLYFLFGAGAAYESGALNAWAVDEYEASERAKTILAVSRWSLGGTLAGALTGAVLAVERPTLPWMAGLALAVAGVVLAYGAPESRSKSSSERRGALSALFAADAPRQILRSRPLFGLLLFTMISQLGLACIIRLWQPAFTQLAGHGIEKYFGVLYVGFMAVKFAANRLLEAEVLNARQALVWGAVLSGLSIIVFAGNELIVFGIFLYLLHILGDGMKDPVILALLHNRIDTSIRATCESWFVAIVRVAELAGFALAGFIADATTLNTALVFGGILSTAAVAVVPLVFREDPATFVRSAPTKAL